MWPSPGADVAESRPDVGEDMISVDYSFPAAFAADDILERNGLHDLHQRRIGLACTRTRTRTRMCKNVCVRVCVCIRVHACMCARAPELLLAVCAGVRRS